nr:flavin reductase family protein [Cohnella sp. WQ 127256]
MIGSIIPRPIAFVTTLSSSGILNAAPYSYFNIVTANPPMISISVQRRNGERKDTARNAVERGEFVVHISDHSIIAQINETAANLPPEESEVALTELTPIASEKVAIPGIAEAKVRMECVLEQVILLGGEEGSPACDLLIGRIVYFHMDEAIYNQGYIDHGKLDPISRLAGNTYSRLGEIFEIERPK